MYSISVQARTFKSMLGHAHLCVKECRKLPKARIDLCSLLNKSLPET